MELPKIVTYPDNIPEDMKNKRQWLNWRYEHPDQEGEKPKKIPIAPYRGGYYPVSATDPQNWTTFEQALRYVDNQTGLAFSFTKETKICGIDLDNVELFERYQFCEKLFNLTESYRELSPSGLGYHIYGYGATEAVKNDELGYEKYSEKRFFTVTGNLRGAIPKPLVNIQQALDFLDRTPSTSSLVEKVKEGVREGSRNTTALLYASFMAGSLDFNEDQIFDQLKIWNEKNIPPLTDLKELKSIASRTYKFKNVTHPETKSLYDPISDNIKPHELIPLIYDEAINPIKTFSDTGEILRYDTGIYHPHGEIFLKTQVEEVAEKKASINFVNEVLAHLQRQTYIDREEFDQDPYLITLENGVLDLRTGLLNEHTPNHLSLIKLPITYDQTAECPAIDKFLSEVVNPQDLITLYEIAGFALIKNYFIHKAFMLNGDTHSGKSTYLKLLNHLIGEDNISHVSIQSLLTNRFAPAELYGKLLNIYADLPNTALKQSGLFKILTGEDYLMAEKKLKNPFKFENRAKLIFSCNEMPRTYDKGDAFFIRWLILNFPNRFDDTNPNTDKKLIEKLTTPQELSGFLNKAIQCAKTLLDQEHFTVNPDVDTIRSYYEKLSNPILAFMEEKCKQEANVEILKKDFYQALMLYCDEKNLGKPTATAVTQELRRLHIEDSADRRKYLGITLLDAAELEERQNTRALDDYS